MNEHDEILQRFADVIRELRLEKGLSHEQLAVRAGLDRSSISLYESGKRVPTITSALRIARGLDMKLSDMIREIEGEG